MIKDLEYTGLPGGCMLNTSFPLNEYLLPLPRITNIVMKS